MSEQQADPKRYERHTTAIQVALSKLGMTQHRAKHEAECAAVAKADELYAAEVAKATEAGEPKPERIAHERTMAKLEGRAAPAEKKKGKS